MNKKIVEITKELANIRRIAENICADAPGEDELTNAENEVFAELANLANSIGNIGIESADNDGKEIRISTPAGDIVAETTGAYDEYPGIMVWNDGHDKSTDGRMALIEYDTDSDSGHAGLQVVAYARHEDEPVTIKDYETGQELYGEYPFARQRLFRVIASDGEVDLVCCTGAPTEKRAKELTMAWRQEMHGDDLMGPDFEDPFEYKMSWFLTNSTGCDQDAFSDYLPFDPDEDSRVLFPEVAR